MRVRIRMRSTWRTVSCIRAFQIGFIFFVLSQVPSVAASEKPVDLSDIIAHIRLNNEIIKDYQLKYKTSQKFLYRIQFDAKRNVANLKPLSRKDRSKSQDKDIFCAIKGNKWFYEQDSADNINNQSYHSKHAFDGKIQRAFHDRKTSMTGVVFPLNYHRRLEEVVTYDQFFANLRYASIFEHLTSNEEREVTLKPRKEVLLGTPCYVIESVVKDTDLINVFWISPNHGFRPLRMDQIMKGGDRYSYLITAMKHIAEEIWLPAQARFEVYKKAGDRDSEVLFSVLEMKTDPSTIKVNSGIDDERFDLTFPHGTQVDDKISKRFYKVGAAPKTKKSKHPPIYETDGRGMERVKRALVQAKKDKKRILFHIGGNWCSWCYKLHDTLYNDQGIHGLLQREYIIVMIDNRADKDVLKEWSITPRGYPYLVIIDASGTKMIEQETGSLVVKGIHNPEKVYAFLEKWRAE